MWLHAQSKENERGQKLIECKYCAKCYVWHGSTTNMRTHLKEHSVYIELPSDDEEEADSSSLENSDETRRLKTHMKLERLILLFIIQACLPFRIVENRAFQTLVKMLCPSWVLPSRSIFSNRILNTQYDYVVTKIKSKLSVTNALALTLDAWTSCQPYPYLGVNYMPLL